VVEAVKYLTITSVPGQGTRIVVNLPIRPLLDEETPATG
jgi:hypothetical protein